MTSLKESFSLTDNLLTLLNSSEFNMKKPVSKALLSFIDFPISFILLSTTLTLVASLKSFREDKVLEIIR